MDIANYCGVVSTAKFVYIKAYDAYSTNTPLIEVMKPDVLAHQWYRASLTTDHGGPVKDDYSATICLEKRKIDW